MICSSVADSIVLQTSMGFAVHESLPPRRDFITDADDCEDQTAAVASQPLFRTT